MTSLAAPPATAPDRQPRTAQLRARRPCPLTPAELRVLRLLADGRSYESIARELGRAQSTVRSQLQSAYRRLGVHTSYQAVLKCVRYGWLALDGSGDPDDAWYQAVVEVMRELVDAVEANHEQRNLTHTQRRYLRAFDDRLRARSAVEQATRRRDMDAALTDVLSEAHLPPPARDRPPLIDELGDIAVEQIQQVLARR